MSAKFNIEKPPVGKMLRWPAEALSQNTFPARSPLKGPKDDMTITFLP